MGAEMLVAQTQHTRYGSVMGQRALGLRAVSVPVEEDDWGGTRQHALLLGLGYQGQDPTVVLMQGDLVPAEANAPQTVSFFQIFKEHSLLFITQSFKGSHMHGAAGRKPTGEQ